MCLVCKDVLLDKMTAKEAVSVLNEFKEEDPHADEVMQVILDKFPLDDVEEAIQVLVDREEAYERNKNS
jgi:hypothetical protein